MVRSKDDPTSAALAYMGIALLLGAFLFLLFFPKPTTDGLGAKNRKELFTAKLDTEAAQASLERADAAIQKMAWIQEPQRVTPLTVQTITALAKASGLQLVAVRPQKVDVDGKPNQLPFLITVSGPYPAVIAFVQDLENPINRLVVTMLQLTSADANSNKVTGSIGALTYLMPPPPAPDPAPAKKETTTRA